MAPAQDTVRTSSLSTYSDCARRSAVHLWRKELERAGYTFNGRPKGIGAVVGTAVHGAAAYTLTEKLYGGSLAPTSAVEDCAIQKFREESAEGVTFDQATPAPPAAEATVLRMARAYQLYVAPTVTPIVVEDALEADTPYGITLTGHSDVLARERACVRDLKTGKRRGNYKPQLGGYALLMKANGLEVSSCAEDYVQRVAAKKPQPPPVSFEHDLPAAETAALNVLRHIASDIAAFRNGDPDMHLLPGDPWAFIANPSSILCSEKWCPAYGTPWCHEWRNDDN